VLIILTFATNDIRVHLLVGSVVATRQSSDAQPDSGGEVLWMVSLFKGSILVQAVIALMAASEGYNAYTHQPFQVCLGAIAHSFPPCLYHPH
jgi:hypothetical protein